MRTPLNLSSLVIEAMNSTVQTPRAHHVSWDNVLSPEFEAYTPEHWLQFEAASCTQHFVLALVYSLILIPGFFGNALLIFLYSRVRSLRSPSNTISMNLALADLLMNAKIPMFIYNSLQCRPALGILGCEIYGFVGGLSGTAAIMTITTMAFERYLTICYPFEAKRYLTKSTAWLVSALIWLYSLAFATPPLIGLANRYVPEGYLTSCTFDYLSSENSSRMFVLAFSIAAWLLPMMVILYSYSMILITVRSSAKRFQKSHDSKVTTSVHLTTSPDNVQGTHVSAAKNLSSPIGSGATRSQRAELRLAKCALSLISLWTLAWTPYALVALIGIFGDQSLITPTVSMVPALFAKLASILDPYVYGFSHPRYRHEIRMRVWPALGLGASQRSQSRERQASRWSRFASFSVTRSLSRSQRSRSQSINSDQLRRPSGQVKEVSV